jgi:hypothetical protein
MAVHRNRAFGRAAVAWASNGGSVRAARGAAGVVAVTMAAAAASPASAGLVAAWNMNGIAPSVSTSLFASSGKGVIDLGGPDGFAGGAGTLAGTTLGALEGDLAGDALSVSGMAYNGKAMRIDVATAGLRDLVFGFATRRSSTGFASCRIDCWDGLMWVPVTSFAPSSVAWEIVSVDLSSFDMLEDGQASLRVVLDGATSSTGSMRFDNLALSGSTVPAPGALALLAVAGCATRGRRR